MQRAHSSGVVRFGYVLARNHGNYEGYWDQTAAQNDPLGGAAFAPSVSAAALAEGPLPNDRTHVLKVQISQRAGQAFEAGATLLWASGTPLGELGATPFGAPYYQFLSPRGSLGRSPAIYDLDLRLAHDVRWSKVWGGTPRLLLDVYHVGNPRRPLVVDQVHYRGVEGGQQIAPNPNYGKPLLSQSGVAYRFGCEVRW